MNFKIIFSILSLLLFQNVQGQEGYEVGGWIGGSQYYGDLNTSVNLARPGLSGGVIGMYNFDKRLSARASLNFGRLRGTDVGATKAFESNRNLSFYSNVYDVNLGVEFNFLTYTHGSEFENMTPYMTLGISAIGFNPRAKLNGKSYELRAWGTEGQLPDESYKLISWGPTLGVGFKMDITKDISFGIEASMRFAQTDYIDDVSKNYPQYASIRQIYGQTAVDLSNRSINRVAGTTGQQRGNDTYNDKYLMFGVRVMKYFSRMKCPKVYK